MCVVYICIKICDENLFDQFVTFAMYFYHFTFAANRAGGGDDDDDADGERQFSWGILYIYTNNTHFCMSVFRHRIPITG